MLTILLTALALAAEPAKPTGELVVDARIPTEVLVDGKQVAQLFIPGILAVDVDAGVRTVRVYTNGSPADLDVVVPKDGTLSLLVGRTGISIDAAAIPVMPEDIAAIPIPVKLRMNDSIGARVTLGDKRYTVPAGQQIELMLLPGSHTMSLRSENGTVVWAHGTLQITGPDPVVMQLSEGRLPEVSGKGSFSSRQ